MALSLSLCMALSLSLSELPYIFFKKRVNANGYGMTGDCYGSDVCICHEGFKKVGNECKSMSKNSFINH